MTGLLAHTYGAIRNLERSMSQLRRVGMGPGVEVYDILANARAEIWKRVGIKAPRSILSLLKLRGFSPGSVTVWHDAESGWFTEARVRPGAPPVYHHVTDEVAVAILKGELTHELEAELMKPDEYLGE